MTSGSAPRRATLVTGASGFIGRALTRELEARAEPFYALPRAALASVAAARAALEGLEVGRVVHLAGGRTGDESEDFAGNVETTRVLVEALSGRGTPTLVLASTAEVYGAGASPFVETARAQPATTYARAKLAAEKIVVAAHRASELAGVVARLGVVYGPGQRPSGMLVPYVLGEALAGRTVALTPGAQTRDFLFVDDAARALVELSACPRAHGEIVNVGTGRGTRVAEAARIILRELGKESLLRLGAIPYRADEAMEYVLDVAKLERLTGWRPARAFADGVRSTLAALRQPDG